MPRHRTKISLPLRHAMVICCILFYYTFDHLFSFLLYNGPAMTTEPIMGVSVYIWEAEIKKIDREIIDAKLIKKNIQKIEYY